MPRGKTRSVVQPVGKFKPTPTSRPRLCVTFDEDVFDIVKKYASEHERSFSDVANAIIRKALVKAAFLKEGEE